MLILFFIMLYAKYRYAEYRYAECRYAERRYAECRYATYHYAECRGAFLGPIILMVLKLDTKESSKPNGIIFSPIVNSGKVL